MKIKFLKFLTILFFVSLPSAVLGQDLIDVSGTVTDGELPLPGANIIVKGTNNGTSTDFDGKYTLKNVPSDAVLVFSYVGFTTKEVSVNGKSLIDVVLESSQEALDDVVVVGYGKQSRAEVTGAVSSIKSEDIASMPVSTADQAMQARAPGVQVVNSGSPGTPSVVRIRGLGTPNDNNPLYVIDGIISGGMNNLNPLDIESIEILKDAATTAVYGSQGSNGVVLITTKSGKPSEKPRITFDAYTGVNFFNNRYDVLNVDQYRQFASEIGDLPPRLTDPQYTDFINNRTNWQDEIFRAGLMQNYNMGISGGNEFSNYRISGGYLGQEGVLISTDYERFNFRANSNFTFGKLKLGQTLGVSFESQTPERTSGGRSLIEHAIKAPPYLPVRNPNNLGGFQGPSSAIDGQDAENPVRAQTIGEQENKSINLIGSVFAEYKIIDQLTFRTQVGFDYSNFANNNFIPAYRDDETGTNQMDFAQITKNTGIFQTLTYTNSLNYQDTFGDNHNFEFLLLNEIQGVKFESVNAFSQNSISSEINQLTQEGVNLSSFSSDYNRLGYLGRVNYNYDRKYLVAASLRRDASSRFGANNRWGWFPSLSAGWNISKEDFMENSGFNNLKLRGSIGVTGNDNIGDYLFSPVLASNFIYPIGGEAGFGTTADGIANPDLKWEETLMRNIGLDIGISDKFDISLEYFNNRTDNILLPRPLPISSGFNNPVIVENVASVETKGFEINFGYSNYDNEFKWSANLNLSTARNEVLSLGGDVDFIQGGNFQNEFLSRIAVGQPLFYFHGFQTDGIYQSQAEIDQVLTANPDQTTVQPGDMRFIDTNGDGQINADDKTNIGNPYPDFIFGFNFDATYKNFDFSAFINGSYGNDIYNTNLFHLEGMTRLFNAGTSVLDRWTGPGTSNTIPRALGAPQNTQASNRFIEDGSFVRLRNLVIGYTFPKNTFNETFSNFRIYISAQNLITLTNYSGLDPEIGIPAIDGNADTQRFEVGIDRGNYPQPKSVQVGLQLGF